MFYQFFSCNLNNILLPSTEVEVCLFLGGKHYFLNFYVKNEKKIHTFLLQKCSFHDFTSATQPSFVSKEEIASSVSAKCQFTHPKITLIAN